MFVDNVKLRHETVFALLTADMYDTTQGMFCRMLEKIQDSILVPAEVPVAQREKLG